MYLERTKKEGEIDTFFFLLNEFLTTIYVKLETEIYKQNTFLKLYKNMLYCSWTDKEKIGNKVVIDS